MCLFAKIDNREFMAFYLPQPGSTDRLGRVEFRDENFQTTDLVNPEEDILILDEEDSKGWHPVSFADLTRLARTKMHESLTGLRELHHTA